MPPLASTVQIMHADYTPISGHLTPEMLRGMSHLRSIGFAGTRLSGTLPTELGHQWLTRVTLQGSSISGTLPTELDNAKGLRHLDASYTSLSGTVPTELFDSTGALNTLNILGTQISGSLPTTFATMGSLRNLYVPRELTQYLRRKYCREELHLPPRFNYFWDLSAAALDSRSDQGQPP